MRLRPTLFQHKDTLYIVIRALPVDRFRDNMDLVKGCRDWLEADHVLKHQGNFLFVEEIKSLEILE